jgi:hypothetical protein
MKHLIGFLLCIQLVLCGDEFALSLNSDEQYAISEIITAMGEKNVGMLLLDAIRLNRLGNSILHVPPLQLLGFVLVNQNLKINLKKLSKNYFKWSSFIEGFGENMEKEYNQGKLLPQIDGFSLLVGGSNKQLEEYVYEQDWEGFVKCLF